MPADPPSPASSAPPAADAPVCSVLMVTGAPGARALRAALESDGGGALRVAVAEYGDAALERLRAARFDAVLLDLDGVGAPSDEQLSAVRELAGDAAVILMGGAPDLLPATWPGADGWIGGGQAPSAIAACVRGGVDRRRLADELRKRSAELAQSEARFRSIVERSADGIVIVDEHGRIQFANPGAEGLFGLSAADLVGREFGIATLAGETTEMDILRRGRDPVVAELRASDTTWSGAAAQIISLRDVTDRKRAEERTQRLLREQAAREHAEQEGQHFRLLADAGVALDASLHPETTLVRLAELMVPRVADWCVVDVLDGRGTRRVAGVHADAGKQDLLEELKNRLPPCEGSPQPAAHVLRAGAAELYRGLDERALRALAQDDAHALLLSRLGVRSIVTVPLEGRRQRLGLMTLVCSERDFDDTDVALAREIAGRAARALENASLYEAALAASRAKSDFLAVMSHELRTPLNAILGFTDLLLAGTTGEMPDQQGRYLGRIRSGAMQLLQIIDEILTYAQTEAGQAGARPSDLTVSVLLAEVAAVAEPLALDKGLELRLEIGDPTAALFSDADKLRQILMNLTTNAVKFTERGAITLAADIQDDHLVVSVADTGIGIAPEALEEIFEPFRQVEQGTTRSVGGTGLGLSVSRRLARLLGGDVVVRSTPGQGSTFTLRVPRRIAAPRPPPLDGARLGRP